MTGTGITQPDRYLLSRATYACEYCRRSVLDGVWHRDHVVPKAHGGAEDLSNMAVACPRCNTNKGQSESGVDPILLSATRLFNPRVDIWDEHFHTINHFVAGITPVGRGTARRLFHQTSRSPHSAPLPVDVGRPILSGPWSRRLEWLYGQRKAAQFDLIAGEIDVIDVQKGLALLDARVHARSVLGEEHLLLIEHCAVVVEAMTCRGSVDDILHAIRLCKFAMRICDRPDVGILRARRRYFALKHALAWRQLTAVFAVAGAWKATKACARIAVQMRRQVSGPGPVSAEWLARWPRSPRSQKLVERRWHSLVKDAANGNIRDFLQLADALIYYGDRRFGEALHVLPTLDNLTARSGYGTDADFHHGVLLMRRQMLAQIRFDSSALTPHADRHLSSWADWGGIHQVRALLFGLTVFGVIKHAGAEELRHACLAIDGVLDVRDSVLGDIEASLAGAV